MGSAAGAISAELPAARDTSGWDATDRGGRDAGVLAKAKTVVPERSAQAEDEDSDDAVCCICLETLRSKGQQRPESLLVTECGHTFHFRCILNSCRQRKQQEPTCPLCRHTLELGPLLLAVKPESVPAPQPRAGAGGRSGEGQLRPPRIVGGQGTNTRPQI